LEHFARGAGVLAFSLSIEISPADRRHMQQSGQRDKTNKKRMPHGRRRKRLRLEQSFFET